MLISIIGLGFVGSAMYKSFKLNKVNIIGYDKYNKSISDNTFEECINTNIMFLCLPTIFDNNINSYDKSCIEEVCGELEKYNYNGIVVIKSTVEPLTLLYLQDKFSNLKLVHNPEFLTARTAFEDFHNQKHIVLGRCSKINDNDMELLVNFYKNIYPNAEISLCTSTESEAMKIYLNCFYSVKIQFFNELYLLSNAMNCDYNVIKNLMLKNNWINPMHTDVPGPDGLLSYGGYCFPKDTNALLNHMKRLETPHMVLQATINERNNMRNDNTNIK
jgi:UDPglucose 6-dehydrogenase